MGVSINHLTIRIGGTPIVSDVHIDVRDGQRVGLIGSSGSGKSMIARAMMGLLPVEATVSGSIDVNGEQIVGMQDRDLAALRGAAIGMVFQNPGASLNPLLTVGKQIALPLELHYDLTAEDRQARVLAMMRKVGLDESLVGRHPHELSGGQQQRVGIARAFITRPDVIFADEPTGNLDSKTRIEVMDMMHRFSRALKQTIILVTHDPEMAAYADHTVQLLDGKIVKETFADSYRDLFAA